MAERPSPYLTEGIFVDGGWRAGSSTSTLDVVDPTTEEAFARVHDGDADDVDAAVRSAQRALPGWAATPMAERIALVERLLEELLARAEPAQVTQTREMGAPVRLSRHAAKVTTLVAREYVEAARHLALEEITTDRSGTAVVRRTPVGVVAAIGAWNGPLLVVANKAVPALLAGCTVVVKPAAETPYDAGLFADACAAAGLPPGTVNVVPGGRETGEALVRHPGVAKVTFTGSTAAGRRIGAVAGGNLTRMSLELGGKSAAIVLPDADVDAAVKVLSVGNFGNSGQECTALSRVLVPEDQHDTYVEALVAAAHDQVLGDPFDPATTMGPLAGARHLERVAGAVGGAVADGAVVAAGGRRPTEQSVGFFWEPTVLTGVGNGMRIAREEVFGPVLSVLTYRDEDDAVAIANDSDFGLHGAVLTTDPQHGYEVACRIRTGLVGVNHYGALLGAPFGGVKASGVGREMGRAGLESFLEYQTVVVPKGFSLPA